MTDLKKRVAELATQNTQLADHLANMCCQADEDCPAEYRTRHFRNTMDAAYDYLKEIGYLKWELKTTISPIISCGRITSCRKVTWTSVQNFLTAWRVKPQAASFKRQASKNNCTNRVDVLKIDSTERYNYENKRSIKNYRLIYKNV